MKSFKGFFKVGAFSAIVMLLALTLMMHTAKAPESTPETAADATQPPSASAAETGEKVQADWEIIQTMGFARCGHSVTRRIHPPEDALGMDFTAFQQRFQDWQVESYGEGSVVMSREIPLFCPMHQVLSVDDSGFVVLTHNEYGDGMAVKKAYDIPLAHFDENTREPLLLGLGFDSQEEAEAWLLAH